MPMIMIPLMLAAISAPFPEPTMDMVEACLKEAVDQGTVSRLRGDHKYMCVGTPATALWQHLETLQQPKSVQHPDGEGRWATMGFPLGACFKQIEREDGQPGTGLSCSVWIPAEKDRSAPKGPPSRFEN